MKTEAAKNNTIDFYLKNLWKFKFPVPADCPAFTLVFDDTIWWNENYVPYLGKKEWCDICCLYNIYCDGHTCKSTLGV